MMVFKFIILAILGFILYTFFKSRNEPVLIQPVVKEPENISGIRQIQRNALFKNLFYGKQKTPEQIYEWDDINIQTGIGHVRIDLSNTVLPKGESIIVVRHFIGNVQILVPYDVEVSVNHSVIAGTTTVFNVIEERLYNQKFSFLYQTLRRNTYLGRKEFLLFM
ncbi:MAG: cell wall-active antibiotics response protein LiaF [Bacillaceae bacterium]|nr:cell wall-active antibiotics response protein LiaF [Bacillaceae bacterium]